MGIITDAVAMPKLVFVTAWQLADMPDTLHPVIGTNYHYVMTDNDRIRLRAHTWDTLAELGLARREIINPVFRATLEVLRAPEQEYYGWCRSHTDNAAILIAAHGQHALRVAVNDDLVYLEPLGLDWLPDDFVSTLPEVPGAPVRATSVPMALYTNPEQRDPQKPLAEPPDTTAVTYVTELLNAPRDAQHQLYTATRDTSGERIRSVPLSAIDLTGRGRILAYTNHDDDGTEYLHVVSGTPHNLITTLERTQQVLAQP